MLIMIIGSHDFKAVHMSKLTRTKKGAICNTYKKLLKNEHQNAYFNQVQFNICQ